MFIPVPGVNSLYGRYVTRSTRRHHNHLHTRVNSLYGRYVTVVVWNKMGENVAVLIHYMDGTSRFFCSHFFSLRVCVLIHYMDGTSLTVKDCDRN